MSKLVKKPAPVTDYFTVEVAVHTILYVRQIYPAELFVRRQKFNTPVFQSRHPALNEYISEAIKAVGDELENVSGHHVFIFACRRRSNRAMWIRWWWSSKTRKKLL